MTAPLNLPPDQSALDEARPLVAPHIVGAKHVRIRVITLRRILTLAEHKERLEGALRLTVACLERGHGGLTGQEVHALAMAKAALSPELDGDATHG